MKNKILFGVNSFFLIAVLASLFLPIDGLYIYAINLGLGILSFIFILVTFFVKRERRFIFLSLFQLALLFIWCVLIACRYNPYRIGWKFYLCFMISPIAFSHFFLAKQIFQKKRVLRCFIFLLAFIFVKVVFFTQFYVFEGWKEYGEDIRDYSKHGQYKVLNERKLKNKKTEKLVDEDFDAIASLINNSDWLKDNYPECIGDFPDDVDISYIKKNIKYSFSVIHFDGFNEADFTNFQLKQLKYAHEALYRNQSVQNWMQESRAVRLQYYGHMQAFAIARPRSWYDWVVFDKYRIKIAKYLIRNKGFSILSNIRINNTDYIVGQHIWFGSKEGKDNYKIALQADGTLYLEKNGKKLKKLDKINYLDCEKNGDDVISAIDEKLGI